MPKTEPLTTVLDTPGAVASGSIANAAKPARKRSVSAGRQAAGSRAEGSTPRAEGATLRFGMDATAQDPTLFSDFDFHALDEESFKEDAVREELVAPLLRRLGYRPTGDVRVERGKSLAHPFIRIGTRNHPVRLVPDYLLWKGTRCLLVLDAKRPTENIRTGPHVEQVYSYAMHPDVRCARFALCNGRELVMFDTSSAEPLFVLELKSAAKDWTRVLHYLGPDFLAHPARRSFLPDFGMHLVRLGAPVFELLPLRGNRPTILSRLAASRYTMGGASGFEGVNFAVSLDMSDEVLEQLLVAVRDDVEGFIRSALGRSPFSVALENLLGFDALVELGPVTKGEHDRFVPLIARELSNVVLHGALLGKSVPPPRHIPRLADFLGVTGAS